MSSSLKTFLSVALLSSCGLALDVRADNDEPPTCDHSKVCRVTAYPSFAKAGICPSTMEKRCTVIGTAPDPAIMECEAYDSRTHFCEAWPQGQGLSYSWTGTGIRFLDTPSNPTMSNRLVECYGTQAHTISVTVYSPQGNATQVITKSLACN